MALLRRKNLLPLGVLAAVLAVVVYLGWPAVKTPGPTAQQHSAQTGAPSAAYNKNQYSLASPNSIWVVVNKNRPLDPADISPMT